MNQHIIDWNLERAADELTWANRAQARLSADPQQFASESESVDECRYMAGMHIASANALLERRTQIGLLDELDTARLDWLADPANTIGNVQLPTGCVQAHPESMRAAIDAAMAMEVGR